MNVESKAVPRRIDRKFVWWQAIYSFILIVCTCLFLIPNHDVGSQPAYWFFFFGVFPSVFLLAISLRNISLAYKCAIGYGLFIFVGSLIMTFITPNFMWAGLLFPIFGFILEALYIALRWRPLMEWAKN